MSLIDYLKKQFSTVIEWSNQSGDLLFYKFPFQGDEIKNASKLIIAPGQGCILVYEGNVTDVLDTEGIYNLETGNHPFITSLIKLRQGFESEHKMKVYFYRTAECVNQAWGTASPIKYVDPVYKFPVELGANGNFSFKITAAKNFFTEILGSRDIYTTLEAKSLIQSRTEQTLTAYLAGANISFQQIDAHLDQLSTDLTSKLNEAFTKLGFILTDFRINGTVFDKDTMNRVNKIADITADSMAAREGGLSYVDMEKLKALRDAARNEGGLAGAGLQIGAGAELGKMFVTQKDDQLNKPVNDPVEQLQKLKLLLNEGILTQEEFDAKKKEWLDKL
jgi:membrane protease subunit (stomatin/prohibitin family)